MLRYSKRLAVVAAALAVVAAGCGGSDESSTQTEPTAVAATAVPEPDDATPVDATPVDDGGPAVLDATADWMVETIGTGIKPALAVGPDGGVAIAYLTEAIEGGVFYATETDGWTAQTTAEGYFYGPIDLAFAPDGQPNIVYHDHQDSSFQPDKGDLTLARLDGDAWEIVASGDAGHDGWDSALRFGPNGELWAAGIEPVDFGTTTGVEFYEYDGSSWTVTAIGSPAITYEFNVAMATSPEGQPVLSYYDDSGDQLHIGTRTETGWVDEVIPDVAGGMFSSLVVDNDGARHVTFYSASSATAGSVMYAVDDGSGWLVETVHPVEDVSLGMTGARRLTSLQLLDDGTPVVASTDRSGVWVSTRADGGWIVERVYEAGSKPLGQQVQLVVTTDAWHIATFDVDSPSPLEGNILHLERAA